VFGQELSCGDQPGPVSLGASGQDRGDGEEQFVELPVGRESSEQPRAGLAEHDLAAVGADHGEQLRGR
jgi:hypothetical protein